MDTSQWSVVRIQNRWYLLRLRPIIGGIHYIRSQSEATRLGENNGNYAQNVANKGRVDAGIILVMKVSTLPIAPPSTKDDGFEDDKVPFITFRGMLLAERGR